MVGTPSFHCRGHGKTPGQGTKILHDSRPPKKKKEENEGSPVLFKTLIGEC